MIPVVIAAVLIITTIAGLLVVTAVPEGKHAAPPGPEALAFAGYLRTQLRGTAAEGVPDRGAVRAAQQAEAAFSAPAMTFADGSIPAIATPVTCLSPPLYPLPVPQVLEMIP